MAELRVHVGYVDPPASCVTYTYSSLYHNILNHSRPNFRNFLHHASSILAKSYECRTRCCTCQGRCTSQCHTRLASLDCTQRISENSYPPVIHHNRSLMDNLAHTTESQANSNPGVLIQSSIFGYQRIPQKFPHCILRIFLHHSSHCHTVHSWSKEIYKVGAGQFLQSPCH